MIDFGDMHRGLTVAEPAIAAAYAILGELDPLAAAAAVVAGYHGAFPLEEDEIALLFPLIAARLAVSVTNSALAEDARPDDPYVTISEAPAWEALERLARPPPPRPLHASGRRAASHPCRRVRRVVAWLSRRGRRRPSSTSTCAPRPASSSTSSVGSRFLGADPRAAETGPLTERSSGR